MTSTGVKCAISNKFMQIPSPVGVGPIQCSYILTEETRYEGYRTLNISGVVDNHFKKGHDKVIVLAKRLKI